jgi:cell division protein FtsQ
MPGVEMDPRILRRRADVSRRQGRPRLIIEIAIASAVVLCGLGWFVLHSGLTSARVIRVVGAPEGDTAAVVAAAGLTGHPPLIDIDPAAADARVEQLAWVGRATISRLWPDGVQVTVSRRVPIGVVAAGPTQWAEVDGTGRVLADLTSLPAGLVQLQVPAKPSGPGTWLAASAGPGVAVASTLPAAFAGQVTIVDARSAGAIRLQLTTPVSVSLGGAGDLPAKYDDIATILQHATLHPGDVIDVSVPGSPVVSGP